eukprot:3079385-Lingulodinium_polyedra.AAC.1
MAARGAPRWTAAAWPPASTTIRWGNLLSKEIAGRCTLAHRRGGPTACGQRRHTPRTQPGTHNHRGRGP